MFCMPPHAHHGLCAIALHMWHLVLYKWTAIADGYQWCTIECNARHVALWRANVVECEVVAQQQRQRMRVRQPLWGQSDTLRLLVGDSSGARSQLSIPFEPQCAPSLTASPVCAPVLGSRFFAPVCHPVKSFCPMPSSPSAVWLASQAACPVHSCDVVIVM